MKEGKPNNDYKFLESYGLARASSSPKNETWSTESRTIASNSGCTNTNQKTMAPSIPLFQRKIAAKQQQQQQQGNYLKGGGESDWFSYNEWQDNRSTTGVAVAVSSSGSHNKDLESLLPKQPLKKILKNKNDFMVPMVRDLSNNGGNNASMTTIRMSGDMKQSLSQPSLAFQQHKAMRAGEPKKRSSGRSRVYYVLLFVALYGLVGFCAYLGSTVTKMVRRIENYRESKGWNHDINDHDSKISLSDMQQQQPQQPLQDFPISSAVFTASSVQQTFPAAQDSNSPPDTQQAQSTTTETEVGDPMEELNKQKSDFNKQPSNPTPTNMKDIIDEYTDKTLVFAENELFKQFRDVTEPFETRGENSTNDKDFPFFWLIPPYDAGGHRFTRVVNECFDLTRADITAPSKHKITYTSQTRNSPTEQLLVGSNLFELFKIFKSNDPIHQKGRMVAFFFHPIQRTAYLFETFKNAANAPESFQKMDLTTFADYILDEENNKDEKRDYVFRVSNWMTRLLSQTPTGKLTKQHVDAATLVLSKKCYVGLFSNMEESIRRLISEFHWDETAPGGRLGTQNCLEEFYSTSFIRDLVVEGGEDWKALEKLNTWDIMLFENILEIFNVQGQSLFPS